MRSSVARAGAAAVLGGFLILLPPACSDDQAVCERAADLLCTCFNLLYDPNPCPTAPDPCEGQPLCAARCLDALDGSCTELNDAYSGMPTSVSAKFRACLVACGQTQ